MHNHAGILLGCKEFGYNYDDML